MAKALKARDDRFYHADLGRIIALFSLVEADLQALLLQEAKVSEAIGKAIFSGVRIEQAVQFCRRIWDATGQEHPPLLERAFVQLGHLNSVRNDLVHYGAEFDERDKEYFVTNARVAHTERSLRQHPLSRKVILDITNDLMVISGAIELHYLKDAESSIGFTRSDLEWYAALPWNYTPPPQSPPPRKTQS